MTNFKLGRWLLVALAIVGLAVAAPAVSAHGDEPGQGNETAADGMPVDGDAADWATWMEGHMTDYMGPNAVDEMESHMGVSVDEMAREMADEEHTSTGMNGQGHGC
ncbi:MULTISPECIES: hypothetical protein [Halolamina]|uniref:Uncharacterized protein n=1 Tax=Halolamina pelagica TaxID=699431 RepID=A0A1I5TSH9_9EURY|nr:MULTISPECIES: hypothetical protein [Halolamina]NHX37785.1 hypothetical protein [Halolamina sp. R1-12]SFP85973.1 hypothetical protein SAMN05216277_11068 [Halolamina pelagica]